MSRLRSRVPGECRVMKPNETRPGTQRKNREAQFAAAGPSPWVRVSLRSPGTREGRATSRRAHEPLAVVVFTMSNSAICSFPRRVAAPGFVRLFAGAFTLASAGRAHEGFGAGGRRDFSNSVPPMRGGWSADRRTLSSGRACDARPPCPGATGTSLGAPPWRFRIRTHEACPGSGTGACSDCPRQAVKPGGRGPDLPALRFAPQRGTPLLAPSCRIVSGRRPSMSEDGIFIQ